MMRGSVLMNPLFKQKHKLKRKKNKIKNEEYKRIKKLELEKKLNCLHRNAVDGSIFDKKRRIMMPCKICVDCGAYQLKRVKNGNV